MARSQRQPTESNTCYRDCVIDVNPPSDKQPDPDPPDLGAGRKIIHADCDSFFASVEMRDDPSLKDLPVAVGGSPDKRGVVATCNYMARRYGVHSAMPMSRAVRLCPNLVIVRGNMAKYKEVSRQISEIFSRYTDLIEPLSLDEAFLDVSECLQHNGSATLMAQAIRRAVREELHITISAGIAPNKFIAKIASDWKKPDGQFTVTPDEVDGFVAQLPVEKLFGVGSVTAARMHKAGLRTCTDLRAQSLNDLTRSYGKFGLRLYELSRGIDNRPVRPHRIRKSVSVERTYEKDLPDLATCIHSAKVLFEDLQGRIDANNARARIDQCFVKVRFSDFTTTTVSNMGNKCTLADFEGLIHSGWQRGGQPVRLLGLGVRLAHPDAAGQLALFTDSEPESESESGSNDASS